MADDPDRLVPDLLAASRDPDAAERVYRAFSDDLLAYLLRRAAPDEAADAMSMTFLDVVSGRARMARADRAYPKAWLMSVARRRLSDLRREATAQRGAWVASIGMRQLTEDEYSELEARMDALRLGPDLECALSQLTVGEGEILRLVAQDGLTAAEASRVLGISVGAGRVRLMRARRRARAILGASGGPSDSSIEVSP